MRLKTFDRTNHNLMFAKLIKCNVPMCIARLLMSWYGQATKAGHQRFIPLYCNQWAVVCLKGSELAPSRCLVRKFSSVWTKNLLSTHIILPSRS